MASIADVSFETNVATFGREIDPDGLRRFARTAEDSGFDVLRFGERIVLPTDIPDEYPFSETGEYPYDHTAAVYDTFQVLTMAAAATEDVRLKTTACAGPIRHPVLFAKQALSLDALSGGRFDLGLGLGWLSTEYEVFDVPHEERASRLDEFLDVFDRACESGEVAFDGRHHTFQETEFYPRPERQGGPPVWIAGNVDATFRRVAEHGVGWLPGTVPLDGVVDGADRLRTHWEEHDRSGSPAIALSMPASADGSFRDPEALRETVEAYADAGVTNVNVFFRAPDLDQKIQRIEAFGEEVIGAR